MAATSRKLEWALGVLAGRQQGVVTRAQLLAAGFTRHEIQRRIHAGLLIPVHPGVYFVVHATSPLAHECAAVLACRPRALLSVRTAARLRSWPITDPDGIDVTVVARRIRAPKAVRIHFIGALDPRDLHRHQGIPITSPSLTLLDLAGAVEADALAKALNEARVQRAVTNPELYSTLDRHPMRRGARTLRALLDAEHGPNITRSEAERRALALMREHGIEPDETSGTTSWAVPTRRWQI